MADSRSGSLGVMVYFILLGVIFLVEVGGFFLFDTSNRLAKTGRHIDILTRVACVEHQDVPAVHKACVDEGYLPKTPR